MHATVCTHTYTAFMHFYSGGMAYLSGGDTWVDIPRILGIPFTQPDKVHIKENTDPHWGHVLKLLHAMQESFVQLSKEMDKLVREIQLYVEEQPVTRQEQSDTVVSARSTVNTDGTTTTTAAPIPTTTTHLQHFEINPEAMVFLSEIQDCIKLLSLRSQQVQRLYQSRDASLVSNSEGRAELQRQARALVHLAEEVCLFVYIYFFAVVAIVCISMRMSQFDKHTPPSSTHVQSYILCVCILRWCLGGRRHTECRGSGWRTGEKTLLYTGTILYMCTIKCCIVCA